MLVHSPRILSYLGDIGRIAVRTANLPRMTNNFDVTVPPVDQPAFMGRGWETFFKQSNREERTHGQENQTLGDRA